MTNKFLLYDLNKGGFLDDAGRITGNDIQYSAVFSEETAKKTVLSADEASFLKVPLTQEFIDSLPFDLTDTAPEISHSEVMDKAEAMEGDFVVLTEYGFYDEKYNSMTDTSRPKVRSFDLDYANLYNKNILEEQGTTWITDKGDIEPIIVPVSEVQQDKLKQLDEFSPEKEPQGFFMKPVGEHEEHLVTPAGEHERQNISEGTALNDALNALETDMKEDLPFDL